MRVCQIALMTAIFFKIYRITIQIYPSMRGWQGLRGAGPCQPHLSAPVSKDQSVNGRSSNRKVHDPYISLNCLGANIIYIMVFSFMYIWMCFSRNSKRWRNYALFSRREFIEHNHVCARVLIAIIKKPCVVPGNQKAVDVVAASRYYYFILFFFLPPSHICILERTEHAWQQQKSTIK